MNPKRILLIQGHPDGSQRHLCHALEDAYAAGATDAGHQVRRVTVARLDFPILRTQADWDGGTVPPGLEAVQADILWAQHLVLFFPLWLGGIPAYFKGFLEQVARPGFDFTEKNGNPFGRKGLIGRSVDTRPPAGAGLETTVVRRHVLLRLQHHDRASLLAGKLHDPATALSQGSRLLRSDLVPERP